MTCRVTVENDVQGSPYNVVVNVCQVSSPDAEATCTERHSLKPGEKVTCTIYSWRQFIQVFEESAG